MTDNVAIDVNFIAKAWGKFEAGCIPPEASEGQRREMKRAFYAGAWYLQLVIDRIGDDSVPENVGLHMLSMIRDELHEFAKAVLLSAEVPHA